MNEKQEAIIEVRSLDKHFKNTEVLSGITIDFFKGEVVCIIGPSGAGKSTFIRCLNNLETPSYGYVLVNGVPIAHKKSKDAKQELLKMGMVFQDFNLFSHMTVLENIIDAPVHVKKEAKEVAISRAKELLDKVGLLDKIDAYPAQLSGGQKQRVAIARALCMEPEIMLFDEPTSALDPQMVQEVLKVMRDLAETGMTMIVVTHEMNFARQVADKILFMANGQVIEYGTPEQLFEYPRSQMVKDFIGTNL